MDRQGQQGLLDTFRKPWRRRGVAAYALSAGIIVFYSILYFTPHFDVLAQTLRLRNRWSLYSLLYSGLMIGGAIGYLRRHGNAMYNRVRIAVNVAVQVLLASALPMVMPVLDQPEFYFSYLWPLDIYKLYPSTLQTLPVYLALYAVIASLVVAPVLAVWWGKRWYCSWVCGCGGLANTFGDPFRHLTSKTARSWRFEQIAVHCMLVLAVLTTALVGLDALLLGRHATLHRVVHGWGAHWPLVGTVSLRGIYGFLVGALLAGVLGTGLYPLLGPRVWCRNFCPMAAMLGLFQKLGRFRIRVKPDMCISCGNCTTYCEMGIDVRGYAQRNQSFTRAACVGCGMCAHVCPRGVLKLENRFPLDRDRDKAYPHLPVVDF